MHSAGQKPGGSYSQSISATIFMILESCPLKIKERTIPSLPIWQFGHFVQLFSHIVIRPSQFSKLISPIACVIIVWLWVRQNDSYNHGTCWDGSLDHGWSMYYFTLSVEGCFAVSKTAKPEKNINNITYMIRESKNWFPKTNPCQIFFNSACKSHYSNQ